MLDLLLMFAGVVALTAVAYFLATFGTKETSFEDALAEQKQKIELENAHLKTEKLNKKIKTKKHGKRQEEGQTEYVFESDFSTELMPRGYDIVPPESIPLQLKPPARGDKKKEKKKKEEPVEQISSQHKFLNDQVNISHPPASDFTVSENELAVKQKQVKSDENKLKENQLQAEEKQFKTEENKLKEKQLKAEENKLKEHQLKAEENKLKEKQVKAEKVKLVNSATANTVDSVNEAKAQVHKPKEMTKNVMKTKEVVPSADKSILEVNAIDNRMNALKQKTGINKIEHKVDVATKTIENNNFVDEKASIVAEKKRQPKEKQKIDVNGVALAEFELLPLLQKSQLTGGEIQGLINVLLNKQQSSGEGEWQEKGKVDPLAVLKRQLEETEAKVREKQEAHTTLSAKISEMRAELNREKSQAMHLKTRLDESVQNRHQLQTAMAAREKQHAQQVAEVRSSLEKDFQIKLQQKQAADKQQHSADEEMQHHHLQLKESLGNAEMQVAVLKQEHEELTLRCQQYEEHIHACDEKRAMDEAASGAQLAEVTAQLETLGAVHSQALAHVEGLAAEREAMAAQLSSYAAENVRGQLIETQHQLQEAMREKRDCELRLFNIESEVNNLRKVVHEQSALIDCLKEEKEALASQVVRPAAEGQENGDVHQEMMDKSSDLQTVLEEKENIIEKQLSEVTKLKKELTHLSGELEAQKSKNYELREKNHKVLEVLRCSEDRLKQSLEQERESKDSVEADRKNTHDILRRIFPDVVLDESLDHSTFMKEFEQKLAVQTQTKVEERVVEKIIEDPCLQAKLEFLTKENIELKEKLDDLQKCDNGENHLSQLEAENSSLNEKVSQSHSALIQTETLLKSLQASVEEREKSWGEKFTEKEDQLMQLTSDKTNLMVKIQQIESSMEKVQHAEQLQSQLKELQEQLEKEEKEKNHLQEQLQKLQEHQVLTPNQTIHTALRLSHMGYMASWVGRLREGNSPLSMEQQKTENVSTNGPASTEHEECGDNDSSIADTVSLVSGSSCSVSESNTPASSAKKGKKKKSKGIFSKLIGKNSDS